MRLPLWVWKVPGRKGSECRPSRLKSQRDAVPRGEEGAVIRPKAVATLESSTNSFLRLVIAKLLGWVARIVLVERLVRGD